MIKPRRPSELAPSEIAQWNDFRHEVGRIEQESIFRIYCDSIKDEEKTAKENDEYAREVFQRVREYLDR